jgi:uncharacterized protein YndB with AHSA1/START domain
LHINHEEDDMDQDAIERSIDIDAPPERVWDLISIPGWWINEGEYREHVIEHVDGIDLVTDPVHGVFAIVTQKLDAPRYAAFRWLDDRDHRSPDAPGTTTEFWIDDRENGVTLRVRESGFMSLGKSQEEVRKRIDDNTEGWAKELEVARKHCTS